MFKYIFKRVLLQSILICLLCSLAHAEWAPIQFLNKGKIHKAIHSADMDGDGKAELLIGRGHEGQYLAIEIWSYSTNSLTWQIQDIIKNLDYDPHDITTGDFNNDGFIDVVVGQRSKGLCVFLNNAGKTWTKIKIDGTYSDQVETADFDQDAHLDIFERVKGGGSRIFYGDGHGNFIKGAAPRGVGNLVPIDLNGDGLVDLIGKVLLGGQYYFRAFSNEGDRTWSDGFGPSEGLDFSFAWVDGAGDLNNDGLMDFVTERFDPEKNQMQLVVYWGQTDDQDQLNWIRQDIETLAEGRNNMGWVVPVYDVNSDGNLDIVISGDNSFKGIKVYYGDGEGAFPHREVLANRFNIARVETGTDFNGDNIADIVFNDRNDVDGIFGLGLILSVVDLKGVTCTIQPKDAIVSGAHWRLTRGPDTDWHKSGSFLLNIPTKTYTVEFKDIAGWEKPEPQTIDVIKGQLKNIVAKYKSKWWSIQLFNLQKVYTALHFEDLNNDGFDELIAGYGTNAQDAGVEIWSQNLNSKIWDIQETSLVLEDVPKDITTGDFNNDGIFDIAVAQKTFGLRVFLNEGDGLWTKLYIDSHDSEQVETADFDLDENEDIFITLKGGHPKIFYGNGAGIFSEGAFPVQEGYLSPKDVNQDGKVDLIGKINIKGLYFLRAIMNEENRTWSEPIGPSQPLISQAWLDGVGDFNQDGYIDYVTDNYTLATDERKLIVFLGGKDDQDTLVWTKKEIDLLSQDVGQTKLCRFIPVSDINGDGYLDITVGGLHTFKGLNLYYGDGQGNFSAAERRATDYNVISVNSRGDYNHDQIQDIVFCNFLQEKDLYGLGIVFNAPSWQTFSKVHIENRQIKVQRRLLSGILDLARPYFINGIVWQPATKAPSMGPDPDKPLEQKVPYGFFNQLKKDIPATLFYWWQQEMEKNYDRDITLLKEMNVNTVYLSIPLGDDGIFLKQAEDILDKFYANNIFVIMAVAKGKKDLCTESNNPICHDPARYEVLVEKFKNHPAILMWAVGQEWNAPAEFSRYGFKNINEVKNYIKRTTQNIKSIDPHHPVTSILKDDFKYIPTLVHNIKTIDIWGLNIYRGANFDQPANIFEQWTKVTPKPFFFSAYGTDSYFSYSFEQKAGRVYKVKGIKNENVQSDYILGLYKKIVQHQAKDQNTEQCTGGFVFEFNDSLWKAGNPFTGLGKLPDGTPDGQDYTIYNTNGFIQKKSHPDNVANLEYFGIVDADRNKKIIFNQLKEVYAPNTPIGVKIPYQDQTKSITLQFDDVIKEGHTTIKETKTLPEAPKGFEPLTRYYDITTTATFKDQVQICMKYSEKGLTEQDEKDLCLYYFNGTAWVDITRQPFDNKKNIICGDVLDPLMFAICRKNTLEVNLFDSSGGGIGGGNVTYFDVTDETWKHLGFTDAKGNLRVQKSALPVKIKIKMTYEGKSQELEQNVDNSHVINFQTMKMIIQFNDSQGTGLAEGEVFYEADTWRSLGKTDIHGQIQKEMLPGQYNFRMQYEGQSFDHQQDISSGPVVFETKKMIVQLVDSQGRALEKGRVSYISDKKHKIGITDQQGTVAKEVLPGQYFVQMNYKGRIGEQKADISLGPIVFQTAKVRILLKDSKNKGLSGGRAGCHAQSFYKLGITDQQGLIVAELLPGNYKMSLRYEGSRITKVKDIPSGPIVFHTIPIVVRVRDKNGNPLAGVLVSYLGWSWNEVGLTNEQGEIYTELLPDQYRFKSYYKGKTLKAKQDLGSNSEVFFTFE